MMSTLKTKVMAFHKDEQGDIVQTGIVLGILAVLALGAMMFLRAPIERLFTRAGSEIDNAAGFTPGF